jgi:O-acetyl-ADP-ribose deacetylase (regulator of RNase III)
MGRGSSGAPGHRARTNTRGQGRAGVRLVSGNLLEAQVEALVNPVNTEGVMGKGLALQFKRDFPENFKAYARACKRGELEIGQMFVFDAGAGKVPRYIVNFPTKQHWRDDSKLEYIERGLRDLVRVIKSRGIASVAIPPLGAGLGRLDWNDVRALIEVALGRLSGVEVCLYEPREDSQ